ncbi:NF-kappa-B-repressing factor [Eucyclogobius newberryi]|uniref:NF-kappa-B-repressing factor n=1 Tax=Eucyclogobius newberryi TaxID=166745 RepID=UPI003B591219
MAGFYHGKMNPLYTNQATGFGKRVYSSDDGDEPLRKVPSLQYGSRPGFEPVPFVSGGGLVGRAHEKENNQLRRREQHSFRQREYDHSVHGHAFDRETSHSSDSKSFHSEWNREYAETSGFGFRDCGSTSNFMARTEQEYTAKFEAQSSVDIDALYSQPQRFGGGNRSGLGYSHGNRSSTSRFFSSNSLPVSKPQVQFQHQPVFRITVDEKQRLITNVASAIKVALEDPACKNANNEPNYNFILSRSIQACKTNPEYTYVNLKNIPPADLPRNKKMPFDGYACELRCQQVYLATGYSGSKNGARDRASEQAVRLFLRPVEVRVVERKYKHSVFEDMVVCQAHSPTPAFVPALCNPEEKSVPTSKGQFEPDSQKHWKEFVVIENAHDAICILNNSAAYNRMKIDYKFDLLSNNSWVCRVFVQDELLGTGRGNKRFSKHTAAEYALTKLRKNQEVRQQHVEQLSQFDRQNNQQDVFFEPQLHKRRHQRELVILENSDNAICIINDTAQFNKVTADYKFSVLPNQSWKCEVYLAGQFVAAGEGPKKIVKHIAANEALKTLKQTHPVVKSNIRKDSTAEAISRSQIMGRSGEEDLKQEIKEDNIGNQLLRKMGWKGGGLGRDGDGIAEPIKVKEQFSREGLGLDANIQLKKQDLEDIIRNYASSDRQDDLRFSTELTNDERKQIHQISLKYGLRSKSYGHGKLRFLIVSRKLHKEQLIGQLLQDGQVGRYALIKPQALH